jgi:hypothetical protein
MLHVLLVLPLRSLFILLLNRTWPTHPFIISSLQKHLPQSIEGDSSQDITLVSSFDRRPNRRLTGGGGTVLQNCNDFGIRTWNDCEADCRARHNNWWASYEGRDENNLTRCVCDYGTNRRNNFTCERRANSPTRRHYSYLSEDNKMDPYGEDFDSSTSEDVEMESYDEDFYVVY